MTQNEVNRPSYCTEVIDFIPDMCVIGNGCNSEKLFAIGQQKPRYCTYKIGTGIFFVTRSTYRYATRISIRENYLTNILFIVSLLQRRTSISDYVTRTLMNRVKTVLQPNAPINRLQMEWRYQQVFHCTYSPKTTIILGQESSKQCTLCLTNSSIPCLKNVAHVILRNSKTLEPTLITFGSLYAEEHSF